MFSLWLWSEGRVHSAQEEEKKRLEKPTGGREVPPSTSAMRVYLWGTPDRCDGHGQCREAAGPDHRTSLHSTLDNISSGSDLRKA